MITFAMAIPCTNSAHRSGEAKPVEGWKFGIMEPNIELNTYDEY